MEGFYQLFSGQPYQLSQSPLPAVLRPLQYYHPTMVPAVVLAAGKSSRMGRTKATLPLGRGDTFLTRIVRTLRDAGVEDVVVVVGHEPETDSEEPRAGWTCPFASS